MSRPPTRSLRPIGVILAVAVLGGGAPGALAEERPASRERVRAADAYAAPIAEAAARFGLPEAWIRAVMQAESGGDPRAHSRAGAMGLMQIMPATWEELRRRYGLGSNPYDVRDNILAGAAYMREMHDRFGAPGFLAAYNAGPARYESHLATGRPLPAETRAYLARLAPIVTGEAAAERPAPPADPLAWTRAPLFVMRPERAARGSPPPRDGAFEAPSEAASTDDPDPDPLPAESLFVRRTAGPE